jgi:uncharacterized small protein (DUF1192 family)
MLKHMRKLFAVLLVMVLVLGLFPTFAAAQTTSAKRVHVFTALENAALDTDVFAKIELAKANAAQPMGGVAKLQEADYVNMIPQVIDAIKSSKTYVPGTLQQNGNFLVWETTVGIPCCYDPRMEAELHNTENEPSAEEIARIEKWNARNEAKLAEYEAEAEEAKKLVAAGGEIVLARVWLDDYGRRDSGVNRSVWNSLEEAEEAYREIKEGNGGYIEAWIEVREVGEFERIKSIRAEIEKLEAELKKLGGDD